MPRSILVTKCLAGTPWETLFRWEVPGLWDYVFVGGAFYSRRDRPMSLQDLRGISLMPDYCRDRTFVTQVAGRWVHRAAYVKMPLLVAGNQHECRALRFPPAVEAGGQKIPLWFHVNHEKQRLVFEIGCRREYVLWRKKPADYRDWNKAPLSKQTVCLDFAGNKVTLELEETRGDSWRLLMRDYLERQALAQCGTAAPNWRFHLHKVLRWLASVRDPQSGLFLEWKWRGRPGFKGGFRFNLPTYNTLIPDLLRIESTTGNRQIGGWARASLRPLLDPGASTLLPAGRVWHNTMGFDPLQQRFRFRNHLGSGLAGYPGGQATLLRALIEAALEGAANKSLLTRIEEGLRWILSTIHPDGRWDRLRYDLPETSLFQLPTGSGTSSIGGNAEGALCLLLAYDLLQRPELKQIGLLALRWLNNAAGDPIMTWGFLRDNKQEELDGISAVFAIHANLKAWAATGDKFYLSMAEDFGYYLTGWQRWWDAPSLDPLLVSFGPRVAPCETAWASESYYALHAATGDPLWRKLADVSFSVLALENQFPGYSEACYYDHQFNIHPHHFECVYTASAVLRTCLQRIDPDVPPDLLKHGTWVKQDRPGLVTRCRHRIRHVAPFLAPLWKRMRTAMPH